MKRFWCAGILCPWLFALGFIFIPQTSAYFPLLLFAAAFFLLGSLALFLLEVALPDRAARILGIIGWLGSLVGALWIGWHMEHFGW